MDPIEEVKSEIAEVKEQIKAVSEEIKEAKEGIKRAEEAGNLSEKQRWVKKEEQLREKEKQLRDEKKQLRDEKARLQSAATAGASTSGVISPAPQALSDFWTALPNASWSDDGKVMTLVDGTHFLGHEGLSNRLYRRDCYTDLQQDVSELFEQEDRTGRKKNRAVAIIGNSGIGKSMLGYLLLYQWATEDPPRPVVIVKRGFRSKPTLLTTTGCFELDAKSLADQLNRPEVRYLVDGLNPMDVGDLPTRAQMVLVTSPDPKIYQEPWKSWGYRMRYMDVWSWDELESCREGVFPDRDPDESKARYDRWGGIPRFVLEKVDSDAQALLEKAISTTPLKVLVDSVGSQAAPNEASHKLLHLRVRGDFETTVMVMASVYVTHRVAYQIWKNEKEALRTFLSSSEGEGSVGALRGNLWEGFCHARLIEGGQFRIRDLSDPLLFTSDKIFQRSAAAPLVFDNWEEIQGKQDGQYLRPRSKTNESVDSATQPNVLFQITVSKRHDLKGAGIKKALEFLRQNGPGAVELYFAVPSDAFMKFQGSDIKQCPGIAEVRRAVKQLALEVSL